MSDTILINQLPTRTWNFLGVNETALPWEEAETCTLEETCFRAEGQEQAPRFVSVDGCGDYSRKTIRVEAPEGSSVTVFETLRAAAHLAVCTQLQVGKNARIRLVQVQDTAEGSSLYTQVSGSCEDGGQIELVQIFLGRGDLYSDSRIELPGQGAGFQADIGYLGRGKQTIDLNLVVNHYGKKTESAIRAAGALKDAAQKIFRGTIDFKKGSSDSVGNEQETVLMLGEDVRNKTVPLILCAEENVVGNHGATIGELDDETLFYLESRGIGREAAENLMARAAIERVTRTVGDPETEEKIMNRLNEEL